MATINGTFNSLIAGTLSGTIGTPGPTGATGATGATGPGVPAGGTAGQFLTKIDGTNYNTDWTTVNLSAYLTKAGNLSGLTDLTTARDNLNLGTANTPVFNGLTAQGSGSNAAQLSPTSLTLTQTGSGIFTIQPSQGIVFPDSTVQVTAYPGPVGATQWGSIGGTLSNQTDLYNALAAKLDTTTAATTYYLQTNPDGFLTDAPSDGSQYARQDGAWAVVTGGGGGSYLPLAGGTMTGAIVFDGTSGQYISKGNFDTSRGGNYGISLVCSIGYEFNWQAGWLTTTNQGSTTPRPLYLDSLAGTTLRAWNSAADNGVEVSHTGINVANATPYYVNVAPDLVKVFEATNELGVSIAHDSIAIQHIDTPDRTSYFTNEYIGFEDMSGTPHSAWIEHDVITVQNDTNTTQMRAESVTVQDIGSNTVILPNGVTVTSGAENASINATQILVQNGAGSFSSINQSGDFNFNGTSAQFVSEGNDLAYISNTNSGTLAVIGVYDDAQGGTFEAVKGSQRTILNGNGITFPDSTVQTTAYTGGGGGGVPEAPEDGYVYGRAIGLWYRIPGINPFTAFAYSITSVGSWSVPGCNIYLTSGGTVYADTPGSATDITLTGGDTAGSSIDLNAFTNSPTISCNSLSSVPNLPNFYTAFYASLNNWSSLPNFSNNNGSLTLVNNTFTSSPSLSVYPGASNLTSVLIDSNSGAFNITGNSFSGCPYLTSFICTNNSGAYCGNGNDSFFGYCTSLTSINFSNCPSFGFNSGDNAYLIDGSGCPVTYVDCSGCAFSDPQNSILSRLASNGLYGGYVNVSGGTNGGIDSGDGYLNTLQTNGWTVIFNSL